MEHSEDLYWLLINGSVVSRFIICRMPRSLAINSRSMGHPAWMRKGLFIVSSCCAFHKLVRLEPAGQRVVCLGTSHGSAKHSAACIVCSLKTKEGASFLNNLESPSFGKKGRALSFASAKKLSSAEQRSSETAAETIGWLETSSRLIFAVSISPVVVVA